MSSRMMCLSSIYHSGPVTALCFHGNTILAGIGSALHIFSLHDAAYIGQLEVLPGRVVHGLKTDQNSTSNHGRICVYGQKCIRLVNLDLETANIKPLGSLVEFSDWIWDVTWLQDKEQLGVVMGHNVVAIFDLEEGKIVRTVHCQEKCIVYCAKFLTSVTDSLVMAAGTVFNQVVLWSPSSSQNSDGRVDALHRLTGHQGVIFSVDYNKISQRICSVSDDRSIRLYQVRFPAPTTAPCLQDWENMDSSLLHVLYGHSARVWDVKLLSSVFVSVGEDSTCCIWSYDGHVIEKLKGHKGKSIWSMTVDKGENYVVTGGGDHSVRLWKLQQQQGDGSNVTSTVLNVKMPAADFPRNTMMLNFDLVLIITDMGNLQLYNSTTDKWTSLMSDAAFSSYSVMSVSPRSHCVAIGNIKGTLRLLSVQDVSQFEMSQFTTSDTNIYDGRILSVHWLEDVTLLTTGPNGVIKIWKVCYHDNKIELELTYELELPASKKRWVSTATYTSDCRHLVCGDRAGSVVVYRLHTDRKYAELVQILPKIHGKAGVTHICCHGDQIYSAGRDGLYRVYSWTDEGNLSLLNSNRVYKGYEWLERLVFTDDGDVQIQGFHTDMFVVWSVKNNQKLLAITCGGGHRAWHYSCHGNQARFVFVKTREVIRKDITMMSNQVILKGCVHGRELCDVKHVCSGINSSGAVCDILATCSEDTSVCLSVLHYRHGLPQLNVLHTLSGHISSVRCLSVCPTTSQDKCVHRKLIFSAGGRAQLKVWRVQVKFQTTGKVCSDDENVAKQDSAAKTVIEQNIVAKGISTIQDHINSNSEAQCLNSQEIDCETKGTCVGARNDVMTLEKGDHENTSSLSVERHIKINCKSDTEKDIEEVDNCCSYECLAGFQLSQIGHRRRKPWRQQIDNSNPETRILDLSSWCAREMGEDMPESLYFMSAACSDGDVRLIAFEEDTRDITLLSSSSFHDHCVLKTCHMTLTDNHVTSDCDRVISKNKPNTMVLSAATDGIVAFWNVNDICRQFMEETLTTDQTRDKNNLKKKLIIDQVVTAGVTRMDISPFFTIQLHQSGINSLHLCNHSEDVYILVTGGDDNALYVTLLSIVMVEDKVVVKVTGKGCHTSAHSAQITGVRCISPSCILTSSIDQRVCVWTWTVVNDDKIEVCLLDSKIVSVSDIANMDVWKQGSSMYLTVCGDGLEVLKLDTQSTATHHVNVANLTKLAL